MTKPNVTTLPKKHVIIPKGQKFKQLYERSEKYICAQHLSELRLYYHFRNSCNFNFCLPEDIEYNYKNLPEVEYNKLKNIMCIKDICKLYYDATIILMLETKKQMIELENILRKNGII